MAAAKTKRILFTGYAPVHFVCFRPLYERLIKLPDVEVFVSGGQRIQTGDGDRHDAQALYEPFGIPRDQILSVEEIQTQDFNMSFTASANLFPPRDAGIRVQIFHGISFRNRQIREQTMNYDFYFIIGPYMHRKFMERGLLEEGDPRGLKIGFPKTDRLLNGELKREDLLRRYGLDGSRPVILYAPTGERHNSLDTMGEDVIRRLAESGRYDLLIKLHDHPHDTSIDWASRLAGLEDAHMRLVRDLDVIPLLFLADLLITDASSVSNEYSLLNRPMVFLDVPKLIKKAMEKKGASVDLDTWGRKGGVIAKKPEDIVEVVRSSLSEPARYSDIRIAMAKDLFYNPGTATKKAVDWLQSKLP
jgi:hypothetical protein